MELMPFTTLDFDEQMSGVGSRTQSLSEEHDLVEEPERRELSARVLVSWVSKSKNTLVKTRQTYYSSAGMREAECEACAKIAMRLERAINFIFII